MLLHRCVAARDKNIFLHPLREIFWSHYALRVAIYAPILLKELNNLNLLLAERIFRAGNFLERMPGLIGMIEENDLKLRQGRKARDSFGSVPKIRLILNKINVIIYLICHFFVYKLKKFGNFCLF